MSEFGMVSDTVREAAVEIRDVGETLQTVHDIGHGISLALYAVGGAVPITAPACLTIASTYEGQIAPILREVSDVCMAVGDFLDAAYTAAQVADDAASGDFDGLAAHGIQYAGKDTEE